MDNAGLNIFIAIECSANGFGEAPARAAEDKTSLKRGPTDGAKTVGMRGSVVGEESGEMGENLLTQMWITCGDLGTSPLEGATAIEDQQCPERWACPTLTNSAMLWLYVLSVGSLLQGFGQKLFVRNC